MNKAANEQTKGAAPMVAFARLTKVDEEKRLVYGRAAQQVPDRQGEELDYDGSKPHFARWSKSQLEASMGKSAGNVRGMHGKVAAGIIVPEGLVFNDAEKSIDVVAHVTDDQEWKKVLTGTYTGFSIGGKYVSKGSPDSKTGVVKYVADPSEVSLVDRPAIPTATFFEVQKKDGTTEKVEFAKAEELHKIVHPHKVKGDDGKTKVVDDDGHVYGTHDDEASADKQLAALYAEKGREEKADKPVMRKIVDVGGRELGLEIADKDLPKQGASFEHAGRTFAFVKLENGKAYVEPVYEVSGTEQELAEFAKAVSEKGLGISDVTKMLLKPEVRITKYGSAAFADEEARRLPIETGEQIRAAWHYAHHEAFASKQDKEKLEALRKRISEAAKTKGIELMDAGKLAKLDARAIRKNLATCGELSTLLHSLCRVAESVELEQAQEGDNSTIADDLYEHVSGLGTTLKAMIDEELREEVEGGQEAAVHAGMVAMAAASDGLVKRTQASLEKVARGARAQKMHDQAVGMGAKCAKQAADGGDLAKSAPEIEKLVAAAVEKATTPVTAALKEAQTRIKQLEDQPMPTKVQMKMVEKSDDTGDGKVLKFDPVRDDKGNVNVPATIIKATHMGVAGLKALAAHVDQETGVWKD